MEIQCLEAILNYGMTTQEAKSYKVCCLYEDALRKTFPKYISQKAKKGDPRKTSLFKYCYKLVRETQHKIQDADYCLYVQAQLDIIKAMTQRNNEEPFVAPACLVGEKAWNRWLVWKKLYEKHKKAPVLWESTATVSEIDQLVKRRLLETKSFLQQKISPLTKENLMVALEGRTMLQWIASHQICEYYPLLSLTLNDWLKSHKLSLDSVFYIDFNYYQQKITPEIESFFKNEFAFEC